MPELENKNPSEWQYVGKNSKGEPKFRRYTNQTLEYVKEYLDNLDIVYLARPEASVIFIYREKDPKSQYSSRYSYYYTTGRWGNDKRSKHYHSNGIEHFMEKYYTTLEEGKLKWEQNKQEAG